MANPQLKIAIAQMGNWVGDIEGNAIKIIDRINYAEVLGADLIIFPELALTGYPPEDLLLRPGFHRRIQAAMQDIAANTGDIHVVCGHTDKQGELLYNAASYFYQKQCQQTYHKQYLPNYSVFDEKRYFTKGDRQCFLDINGFRLAILICEDVWHDEPLCNIYNEQVDIVLTMNASPFRLGKHDVRVNLLEKQASKHQKSIVYTHCVGGQDDLVFDGGSIVVDAKGEVVLQAPFFDEAIPTVTYEKQDNEVLVLPAEKEAVPDDASMIYQAIMLGLRDYVTKNNFPGVVLGLSGGIDSALCLALAVDALGKDKVKAVFMPSRYSDDMSYQDAKQQAETLGVSFETISIEPVFASLQDSLAPLFVGTEEDITEQNLQARIRGTLLMAISNKFGDLVLATGNKSEYAVGYSTLYGDMCGGYAPIKDVYKTNVYRLAEHRNRQSQVIPRRVLERAPTAELKPDQKDEDTLPAYELLDQILYHYIERDLGLADIVEKGFDKQTVFEVLQLVDRNEYKRRQAAPGVRVSERAFGRERRYPITSAYGELRKDRILLE